VADNQVLIEFQIVQKGKNISVIQKETDKLAKSQDKAAASQKRLSKQQEIGYGRQKQGLVQTANGTKNFSKLAQTIGTDTGGTTLVGAYATLAANVFAATAAFNALSKAAEFKQLQQGLEIVGNQSGRTLSVLANGLRDATEGALSLEQASRGAALGVSGGFGSRELEGLAEIAKGASIALGRDMADAFDRLTRGAIKLEPEILDELGIMVRLDDAVEMYAAQLNKSASSLSQLERRQAFMNAILEQGSAKFGDIAKEADPTPYQKLGATFGDLVRNIFTFVNETLMLNKVVGFLSESTTTLFGVMVLFGSTIAGQILPGLANAGARAADFAQGAASMAEETLEVAAAQETLALANIKSFEGGAKNFELVKKDLTLGKKGTAARAKALKSLEASERARSRNLTKYSGQQRRDKEIELEQIRRQIRLVRELQSAEAGQSAARMAATEAQIAATFAQEQAEIIQGVSTGELGLAAALTASNAAIDRKEKQQQKANKTGKKATGIFALLTAVNTALSVSFKKLGASLKVLSASFLRFLPVIGLIVSAVGVAILIFDKVYNTEAVKKFKKKNEELNKVLESLPEKGKEFTKSLNSALSPAQKQIRQFEIISNSVKETNELLKETIKLREEAGKEGKGFITTRESNNLFTGPDNRLKLLNQTIFKDVEDNAKLSSDEVRKRLRFAFMINESAEYRSFEGLLKSDIPGLADALLKKVDFEELFKLDPTKDRRDILALLAQGINQTEDQFGSLGSSVKAFSQELTNAERVGSSFIQKFFPKTSTTDIIDTTQNIQKGIEEIKAAATTAGKEGEDMSIAIGTALTEIGPNMRRVFGAEIRGPIEEIIDLRAQLEKVAVKENADGTKTEEVLNLEAQIKQKILNLGKDGATVVEETLKTLTAIQSKELLRKATLEKIAISQKVINQATKFSETATAISLGYEQKKLDYKKEENEVGLKQLANTHGVNIENMKSDQIVAALLVKQKELKNEKAKESEIVAITLKIQERKNLLLQEEMAEASKVFRIDEAREKSQLQLLQSKEQILEAETKILELEAKREAFSLGRSTVGTLSSLKLQVEAEKERLQLVKDKAVIEENLLQAQAKILKAELMVLAKKQGEEGTIAALLAEEQIMNTIAGIDIATDLSIQAIKRMAEATEDELGNALKNAVQNSFFDSPVASSIGTSGIFAAYGADKNNFMTDGVMDQAKQATFALNMIRNSMLDFQKTVDDLFGEDGAVVSAIAGLAVTLAEAGLGIRQSFAEINELYNQEDGLLKDVKDLKLSKGLMKFAAVGQVVSSVLQGFSQVLQADAQNRIAKIDQAIEAEKRLDGKSAQSLQKIKTMEAQKEAIERKAFERNKKLQIANAIISTASAAAMAYTAAPPPFNIALAAMIGALGLAQVAIIRKTQFQGGNSTEAPKQTALEIGKRGSAVDVAKGTSGGELNYLRGGRTDGTNLGGAGASFPGAAMGRRGYADGGVVVGERGPEVITPTRQVDVTPNYALGTGTTNVNFSINAVDAAGVEDVLMNQRGNIIRMIREAANENGERFLEDIDTQAYGSSK